LTYPSPSWTLADLSSAIRQLAQKDASNAVAVPGLDTLPDRRQYLFASLLSSSLFDVSSVPNPPHLATSEAEKLLTTWAKLEQEGLVGTNNDKAPFRIGTTMDLTLQIGNKWKGVLLPGNQAGLDVQGFAVSTGTQYPEQAYALASFLTTRSELARRFLSTPARKSLSRMQGSADLFA
jgi:hypothetical protein